MAALERTDLILKYFIKYGKSNTDMMIQSLCSSSWSNIIKGLSLENCYLNDKHVELICKAADEGKFKHLKDLSLSQNQLTIHSLYRIQESKLVESLEIIFFHVNPIQHEDLDEFINENQSSVLWLNAGGYFLEYENLDKGYELYQKAAELGDGNACMIIAFKYEQRENSYEYWLRKSLEFGCKSAALYLGDSLYQQENYEMAFNYYLEAAHGGVREAMKQLAIMYENGEHVEKDYIKSKNWLLKSNFNDQFLEDIGLRYLNGTCGFENDLSRAVSCFQISKSRTSTFQLAKMYMTGNEIIQKDFKKGFEMLTPPYINEAKLILGRLYSTGAEGIPKNFKLGIAYLDDPNVEREGADEILLGKIYIEEGIEDQAISCFERAVKKGSDEALLRLAILYDRQNKRELAQKYRKLAEEKGLFELSDN